MIETYGSDRNAKDICRVLRVPGFLNRKHGDPHQVRVVSSPGWRYSRAEILAAFPPIERPRGQDHTLPGANVPHVEPGRDDSEERRIRDALFSIDATERHGVRLGHIVIDTVAAVCNMKDEDDNAEATKICNILRSIFEDTAALMAPVHHYGKNATSGLRGASAWKASADVVEAVLADIDALSGETLNREVVFNKARDGVQGPLSPFNLEYVSLGLDQYGEDYGSCRVVPIDGPSRFARTAKSGKGDRAFRDAFGEVLDGRSETITPRAGMAPVRAVRVTDVRGEFDRRYVTGRADKKEAADTKRKAFDRALNKLSPGEFGAADIGGVEWVWRVQS